MGLLQSRVLSARVCVSFNSSKSTRPTKFKVAMTDCYPELSVIKNSWRDDDDDVTKKDISI